MVNGLVLKWGRVLRRPPNLITASRLFLMSPIASGLLFSGEVDLAWKLVITAALSDWLDGALSKLLYGHGTLFGKVSDPMADKIFIDFVLVTMWSVGRLPDYIGGPVVLVTVVYDVYMTWRRWPDFIHALDEPNAPAEEAMVDTTWTAKFKTAVQFGAIVLLLVGDYLPDILTHSGDVAFVASGVMVIVSGINYSQRGKPGKISS